MKITINKSAKRVVSLVLAFAMLVGSLFVANVGVTFDAKAETLEVSKLKWEGDKQPFSDTVHQGSSSEDAIIISTPAELAYLIDGAGTNGTTNNTAGKYYKVADNLAFDMNKINWSTFYHNDKAYAFAGNFDGNGLVIYNLSCSGSGAAGLFLQVNGGAVIKNVAVKDSSFASSGPSSAIIGMHVHDIRDVDVTIENCLVENCAISSTTTDKDYHGVGTFVSTTRFAYFKLINCADINNTHTAANAGVSTGIVGHDQGSSYATVSNCVVYNSAAIHSGASIAKTYSNVYTDQTLKRDGIINLTTEQMIGSAAKNNMILDFVNIWFLNTNGVPELRAFHNIVGIDNEDGTHNEHCDDEDCDLVGFRVNHLYNIVDYTTNTSSCVCGVIEFGTNDVWDGTKADKFDSGSGTEDDPYIIKTVEQLFLMVRSTGINDDGTPIYYEIDDSVNALYINDTRSFADMAAFKAAVLSLKNWSADLTTEEKYCGDENCTITTALGHTAPSKHTSSYVDYFGGRFNGNGVTIYGLYSKTDVTSQWANGVGFVPMLTGDAVIKNVVFDTNYVKSNSGVVGVVSSSTGIWEDQYKQNLYKDEKYDENGVLISGTLYTNSTDTKDSTYETPSMCPKVAEYLRRPEQCNAAIMNVVVSNSYLQTTNYQKNSYVSGFVSSVRTPKSLVLNNCMFDGTNVEFVDDATTKNHYAMVSTYEKNTHSQVVGCVNIIGDSGIEEFTSCNEFEQENNNGTYTTFKYLWNSYSLESAEFTVQDAPLLNWTTWDYTSSTPMPKITAGWLADKYTTSGDYHISSKKLEAITFDDKYAGYDYSTLRRTDGVFNNYDTLLGSGTQKDPYIISDAITLYIIIASGGTHHGVPQHFKLDRNIDLGGLQWVDTDIFQNTQYGVVFYQYVPFAGILDGAGHTIYNLYTADDDNAGFIPVLDGGTVKNLHFKNAYVASSENYAGIITGWMEGGASVTDCSVEGAALYSEGGYGESLYIAYNDDISDPEGFGTITDCYYIGKDEDVNDVKVYITDTSGSDGNITATEDDIKTGILSGNEEYTSIWYLGGSDDAIPHLIANAKAQPCADIDGDGIGEEYTTRDATVLKKNLLWKSGYDYIYGDVTGNGTIDMRDLAALQREMLGKDTTELDGFWPNVKSGKFTIYYSDTDNYDFARKLELHLESMTGSDITKTNTGDASKNAIKLETSGEANQWSYTYDVENAVLTFKGGSFTAVEAAVDYFMENVSLFDIPQNTNGEIDPNKNAVTVNGTPYYYAWGDEFNSDVNGTVSYDKWILRSKGIDPAYLPEGIEAGLKEGESEGAYIKAATDEQALGINQIRDGKLVLKRGVNGHKDYYTSGVSSIDSMLFKQGYLEMKTTLPADGYAFPAWWLLTHNAHTENSIIDNSLFSKVYKLNGLFDGTTNKPTPTNVSTYKYQLPTQTLEIDLFEIIQKLGNRSYDSSLRSYVATPATVSTGLFQQKIAEQSVKFNIHKWYTYSVEKTDDTLTVYDLDWSNAPEKGQPFTTKLLTATKDSNGNYVGQNTSGTATTYDRIRVNTDNLKGAGVNGAITYQGNVNNGKSIEQNMESYVTDGIVKEMRYGFLWTADTMKFIVYKDGSTGCSDDDILYSYSVDSKQLKFDGENYYTGDNYGFNQYAYMLIENSMYTGYKYGGTWYAANLPNCDMTIDYVRIYQLDGARNIITPESESIYDR